MNPMAGLLGALRFLTRMPLPRPHDIPHRRVVPWFPLAGAIIGATLGASAVGLTEILSPLLAATIAVVVGVMLTGAFHEDGLADIADAFGGGWDREQRLTILKDSRHGTYGVAALCCSIVVRVAAAATIAGEPHGNAVMFAGFVAAHTLARAAAVGVLGFVRPAAPDVQGLGVAAGRELRPLVTVASIAGGVLLVAIATGWWVGPLAIAAMVGALAVAGLAVRKIGGVVGDVLGAAEQVAECLVLIAVAGLAAHHPLWWA